MSESPLDPKWTLWEREGHLACLPLPPGGPTTGQRTVSTGSWMGPRGGGVHRALNRAGTQPDLCQPTAHPARGSILDTSHAEGRRRHPKEAMTPGGSETRSPSSSFLSFFPTQPLPP